MFQNISEEAEENIENYNDNNWKLIAKNMFKPHRILLYIIAFFVSMVSILDGQAPFALAIFAAACSSGAIAFPVFVAGFFGTFIGMGREATLLYLLNSFVLLGLMLLINPKLQVESRNERRKIGIHLIMAVILVQAFQIFTASFTIGVVLQTIFQAIIVYIFYKIFVNSISVVENIGTNKIFTAEEAIGASLLVGIAICAIGPVAIFGFSIRNILCMLLVALLAWRNGALIGTTAGVTIGVILAMLGFGEPGLICVYAIGAMIVGILSKTNKIGLLVAIILGAVGTIFLNNVPYLTYIEEFLIATAVLLVLPKNVDINIEDIIGKSTFLPVTKNNRLTQNKNTIFKLNSMSQAIDEIAKSYKEAAATIVQDDEVQNEANRKIFIEDFKNNLETIQDNFLYEDLIDTDNGIANDIFAVLVKKDEIEREDIVKIFENHNIYIFGVQDKETERQIEKQIYQVQKNINYTYQISKVNFIWKKKISENNKAVSEQLNNVSKAINNMAKDIKNDKEEKAEEIAKFKLNIGISKTTKNKSEISGDTSTQMKLKDGKYLIAISDGMGTGEKAKQSSKKAITMLENLLASGFKNEESIKLINSALSANSDDEMYATLDISVLDVNAGNGEFAKSGACPTYIKTKDGVKTIKSNSMPTGMLSNIELMSFDRDIEAEDIIVMCTDGVIDSAGENKQEWLKDLLKEVQTDNVQKIADIIGYQKGIGFGKRAYNDKQVMYLQADITRLKELGFRPKVSFDEGIRRIIELKP